MTAAVSGDLYRRSDVELPSTSKGDGSAEHSSSNVSPAHAPSGAGRELSWRLSGGQRVGWRWYVVVCALSWLCYVNALGCGFVFDDASAIRDNRDLRPSTPIGRLFANDFWGTAIHKAGVLLLHYRRVCSTTVPVKTSVAAALLFAVHPVHTEAVTGVVGRAESLSSVFFLLSFLAYSRAIGDSRRTEWRPLATCVALVVLATLSKEQGITVVAVCFVYEIFVVQQIRPNRVIQVLRSLSWSTVCASPTKLASSSAVVYYGWHCLLRIGTLSLSAFLLMAIRLHIMGAQLPVFTK
ncbi:protein O-mannosyl-transferase TMTC3-like [Rhipicephalus sanguineus]|uniref:protein O-mannosyl-transferase TMTC3-like n=1 Tax=Rhipicephalus sanguineus TaxID=34632 RepID=UPI00189546D7|nr:protein O-mannosyl-transferase TMTC3-like [Rhipicephalus sanguineus]